MLPLWALLFILATSSANDTVGLNCSGTDDCGDEPPCPADSTLNAQTEKCVCSAEHCSLPRCPVKSKRMLTHNATGVPGDCCDVYECISESEVNCTGVVCPKDEEVCPSDSSRLPKSLKEGDCCGVSHGCECFPCSPPSPSFCLPTQTIKVLRPGNRKPGTCCPVYECQPLKGSKAKVCIYDHEEKPDGSKWKKNQCSECTCIGGMVHCATNCPPLPDGCVSTTIPKGHCCPICINPSDPVDSPDMKPRGCMTDRGVVYEDGATWEEDDCTYCACKDGYKSCQAGMCQQNENSCKLPCEPVFSKDGSGNMLCKCFDSSCPPMTSCSRKCKHGYKTDKNGCTVCKCDYCRPVDNCKKKCPHGLQTNDKGCPICKCKQSPAINESIDKPTSTSCITEEGIPRDDGEVWFDGCRQCYCYGGKEMCALVSCPKLTCSDPIASKNSCCPICPGNETRSGVHVVCYGPGGVKKEGETWSDGCMECMCHGGRVMCHQELCPPTICTHPLPLQDGSCCPKCPQPAVLPQPNIKSCESDRPAGSQWRRDSCVSCICNNGTADCYTQVCNQLDSTCKHPLQVKNQCCSICFDNFQEENTCQMGNVTFSVGDVWEVKKCERCTCGPGHLITCTQTVCESGCSNSNPCCPDCPGTFGHDGGGLRGVKLWMLLFLVCTIVTFALAFCTRYYCQKRHRYIHEFKICDPVPRNCNYKFVATYENPSSPLKGPV
uniref:Cysteine-rich motor neuron 1 protein n=2 Tax=Lygus hesperus TaxID=30085 RepID=A0A0A9Z851_LYGHE